MTDAKKGVHRQTQRIVKHHRYHLVSRSWRFGSYSSYKREDTCSTMLASVGKNTGTVHHLCTTGRCGTKHPSVAATRLVTLRNGYISYSCGSRRSVTLVMMTCVEEDAGFESFVVAKYHVTQQSKRRFYLELLLEPGSKPWYVVVVVIFL